MSATDAEVVNSTSLTPMGEQVQAAADTLAAALEMGDGVLEAEVDHSIRGVLKKVNPESIKATAKSLSP
jgi:predicted regulator of amino acid metabolism with ACT domain